MTKVIECGPRGVWRVKGTERQLMVQITKVEAYDDGTFAQFILVRSGEWHRLDFGSSFPSGAIHLVDLESVEVALDEKGELIRCDPLPPQ